MGRGDGSDGEDAAPEALFCAQCGTDINPKKEEYIRVNCTIDSCRQNYHTDCMTDFLLAASSDKETRSRERYEISAKKRPAMLLLQHWKCPCVYVAPGVKADQPCMGFTLSGDMIKPAKNIAPPPPAAPRGPAQKKAQLPSLRATKKPVVKQLQGSTHFTAHVPVPGSGLGGGLGSGRNLLGDPLGAGGGGGAKTFAQEQEEARKAAEKKRRRKGSTSAAAAATPPSADDSLPASATPPERSISAASSIPSAEALPVPLPLPVDPTQRASCISSLTEMGFSYPDAEAATDAAGGEVETALQLLTSGAVGGPGGSGWAGSGAPGTPEMGSHPDWHAHSETSQPGSWDWASGGASLKAQASDWGQQYAAVPAAPAASATDAAAEADAANWPYVPPPQDRGVADDHEVDELMAMMLGMAC